MIYLLDTNTLSDFLRGHLQVVSTIQTKLRGGHYVCICQPIYYEIRRGLFLKQASAQLAKLEQQIIPQFEWLSLDDDDWTQAARFWADAKGRGKQLSDVDLLLAAMAYRRGAVIASSDRDFDTLPVRREDWRTS